MSIPGLFWSGPVPAYQTIKGIHQAITEHGAVAAEAKWCSETYEVRAAFADRVSVGRAAAKVWELLHEHLDDAEFRRVVLQGDTPASLLTPFVMPVTVDLREVLMS